MILYPYTNPMIKIMSPRVNTKLQFQKFHLFEIYSLFKNIKSDFITKPMTEVVSGEQNVPKKIH